ncbi:MAG: uncharacterized protein QOI02_1155, partial [Actinomycetota bacterium]|nr:uncharacterized protein [Actinomycetota bacterium]
VEPLRRLAMYGIPALLGIFAGVSAASSWPVVLQYFNRTSFGKTDPQFHLDISFFFYDLPFWRGIIGFASAVVIVSALAALATSYLYGAVRFNGREVRISRTARIQIATTVGVYIALQAVSIWFDQYTTLTSASSGFLSTGAGYTEVHATIPSRAILAGIAVLVAILFFVTAVIGRWRLPIIGTALLVVSAIVIGAVYPAIVQRFQVKPSEKTLESAYIQRNITATRDAYGVAGVVEQPYAAKTDALENALRSDAETTANIRILDPALVTKSYQQLQRIKQYYSFPQHLDVDRYTIDGKTQDTVISVRELNQQGLGDSSTAFNDTFVYTHGYGVVAAYGNQRSSDGQPVFLESGIPVAGSLGTFEPRVYFGENSPNFSIVGAPKGAKATELDYPSSSAQDAANTTTTFSGNGGPKLDNLFTRLVYAIKFQSEQVVLSDSVNNQSQILYDRDPRTRVSKVAPYLTLDSDSYPAIVNGRIVWIVDGYTTSDSYPYSRTEQLSNTIADSYTPQPRLAVDNLNYIRNSVKATVDAYSGKVTLYAWDNTDPVLKTWEKIFPSTVKPQSDMSTQLLAHVRYPADLFKVQRAILGSYHVTTPGSFYSSDDQWITPNDPTSSKTAPTTQPPYYLTMQVPGTSKPAFTLYSTFIPKGTASATNNALTGYLSVDSDVGPNYGKLSLLTLPKEIPGPGQVENQFDTDPTVSQALNLLRQGKTQVVNGNLLTLPVGGGLLYVQPVYVESTGETSYPLLQKVLVAFGTKIAFENTLDAALDSLFGGNSGASAGDGSVPTPTPTGTGTPTGTPTPGPTTPPSTSNNPALTKALQDAATALKDREAAYAKNDLVAAAQADKRLQAAITAALLASNTTP